MPVVRSEDGRFFDVDESQLAGKEVQAADLPEGSTYARGPGGGGPGGGQGGGSPAIVINFGGGGGQGGPQGGMRVAGGQQGSPGGQQGGGDVKANVRGCYRWCCYGYCGYRWW